MHTVYYTEALLQIFLYITAREQSAPKLSESDTVINCIEEQCQ